MFFRLADNTNADSVASHLRRKRLAALHLLLADYPEPVQVLDVGGEIEFWKQHSAALPKRCQVTALNVNLSGATLGADFTEVRGDARAMPQYASEAFDVVFSNSVIEHVGTLYDQMAMAREVRRVAKSYMVQTPNRYFPLEPHFLVPFWQFYPTALRRAIYTRFTLGWMQQQPDRLIAQAEVEQIRLLTAYEMSRCFPDAEMHREKIGPFTKSLIAIRRGTDASRRP